MGKVLICTCGIFINIFVYLQLMENGPNGVSGVTAARPATMALRQGSVLAATLPLSMVGRIAMENLQKCVSASLDTARWIVSGIHGLSGATVVPRAAVVISFNQGIRMWSNTEAGLVMEMLPICKNAMSTTAQVHYMINSYCTHYIVLYRREVILVSLLTSS